MFIVLSSRNSSLKEGAKEVEFIALVVNLDNHCSVDRNILRSVNIVQEHKIISFEVLYIVYFQGITGHEVCHYFWDIKYRMDWEGRLLFSDSILDCLHVMLVSKFL